MKRNDPYLKNLHAHLRDIAAERDAARLREQIAVLRAGIRHPLDVADSGIFTDSHPIRIEALAVFDAFEAVTNGMENPEAMEMLAAIPEDSLFSPWKPFIRAIAAYYRGDDSVRAAMLAQIPADSVPGLLGPLLASVPSGTAESYRTDAERELAAAVVDDDPLLRSGLSQLEDALNEGLEELFIETAVLLFRELAPRQISTAERLLLWSLRALHGKGLAASALSARIRPLLPACRLHRIEAVAAANIAPESALLSWIRSLTACLRDKEMSRTEAVQNFALLEDLLDAAEKRRTPADRNPGREKAADSSGVGLQKAAEELQNELSFHYGLPRTDMPPASRPVELLRALATAVTAGGRNAEAPPPTAEHPNPSGIQADPGTVSGKPADRAARKSKRSPGLPKQLELFAFSDTGTAEDGAFEDTENAAHPETTPETLYEAENARRPRRGIGTDPETAGSGFRLPGPAVPEHIGELMAEIRPRPRYAGPGIWFAVMEALRRERDTEKRRGRRS